MRFVPNAITRSIAGSVLQTKKNSPHIFFAAGVTGVIGGTVLACRATLKLEDTLDEVQRELEVVKNRRNAIAMAGDDNTPDEVKQATKDLTITYGISAYRVAKLYAPAIGVGVVSIGMLTGSHIQLTRRNAALTATIGLVSTAYEEYRNRVRRELGEERELDIYHAVEAKVVAAADGMKQVVKVVDPNKMSPYARFFDEYCSAWEKNAETNRLFVQCQQTYANQKLQAQGFLFLNDVYDMFGIERSQAGQIVGWVIGGDGDNYIDFGMFEAYNRDFINGNERSILLDFNVDGVILEKIGRKH